MYVYKNKENRKQKIRNKSGITFGRQWSGTLSHNSYFYEAPSNMNGKMSQRLYIDSIREPVVKP